LDASVVSATSVGSGIGFDFVFLRVSVPPKETKFMIVGNKGLGISMADAKNSVAAAGFLPAPDWPHSLNVPW
jgi:hypothetical protein